MQCHRRQAKQKLSEAGCSTVSEAAKLVKGGAAKGVHWIWQKGCLGHLDENNFENLWEQKPDGNSYSQQHGDESRSRKFMFHLGK